MGGRVGASEVLPLKIKKKEGGGGVLANLKGCTTSFGVVLTRVLTILEGGHKWHV